jgi:hypothetical protein
MVTMCCRRQTSLQFAVTWNRPSVRGEQSSGVEHQRGLHQIPSASVLISDCENSMLINSHPANLDS